MVHQRVCVCVCVCLPRPAVSPQSSLSPQSSVVSSPSRPIRFAYRYFIFLRDIPAWFMILMLQQCSALHGSSYALEPSDDDTDGRRDSQLSAASCLTAPRAPRTGGCGGVACGVGSVGCASGWSLLARLLRVVAEMLAQQNYQLIRELHTGRILLASGRLSRPGTQVRSLTTATFYLGPGA